MLSVGAKAWQVLRQEGLGSAWRRTQRSLRFRLAGGGAAPVVHAPEEIRRAQQAARSARRILLVTHDLSLSGAPMMLFLLARSLRDRGYSVIVASPSDGPLRPLVASAGIEVGVWPGLLDVEGPFMAHADSFDVVVANTITAWRLIHLAHSRLKPSVWWIHESQFGEDMAKRVRPVARALAIADAVVFPAAATAARYARFAARGNAATIHYGLDAAMTRGGASRSPNVGGPLRVANIGSIESRKGQDVLLRSIAALPPKIAEACDFYFVGRALEPKVLAKLQRAAQTRPNLHLVGEASHDVAMSHLQAADVLVLASRDEVLPVTILEAMSLGKGIVATRAGGVAEMIEDGVSGLLVDVASHRQMAEALNRLFRDRTLLARLGDGARQRYDAHFTLDRFGEDMAAVVRRITEDYRPYGEGSTGA